MSNVVNIQLNLLTANTVYLAVRDRKSGQHIRYRD